MTGGCGWLWWGIAVCAICWAPDPALTQPTVYSVGEFQVIWDPADSTLIIASHNRTEWTTSHGTWMTVASTTRTYQQYSGNFLVTEQVMDETDQYTIDTIYQQQDRSVIMSGTLFSSTTSLSATYTLTFTSNTTYPSQVMFDLDVKPINVTYPLTRVSMSLNISNEQERIYGGGYQYSYSSLRGHRVPIFVREQGVGRGLKPLTKYLNDKQNQTGGDPFTSYGSIPLIHTSQYRLLLLHNTEYTVLDISHTYKHVLRMECDTLHLSGHIITATSPLDALTTYTEWIGRQPKLPDWISQGAIVGMQGGQHKVISTYNLLRSLGCPVAAFWLQDWVGSRIVPWGKGLWWNWEYDMDLYPQWPSFISQFRLHNVSIMSYINPMLKDVSTKPHYRTNYYAEALDNKYFVMTQNGTIWSGYDGASLIDLTNPAACSFYKQIMINMLHDGVMGWMSDFGEALPMDAMLWDGTTGYDRHNMWPQMWMELIHETVYESGIEEIIWFARSAWIQSPQYTPLAWMGDQLVSWDAYDGLASSIMGMLSAGLMGMQYSHTDIGGYTAESIPGIGQWYRTKELFMRWCEFAAFTPIYRSHEGSDPEHNWQFNGDQETIQHYTRMAIVYSAWSFYRKMLIDDAVNKGWPIVRHMYIHYPDDPIALDQTAQYLIGEELLVAPVIGPNTTTLSVYLPKGQWLHTWTGTVWSCTGGGMTVVVNVPMGQPAVFSKLYSAVGVQFRENLCNLGIIPSDSPACHTEPSFRMVDS